MHISSTKFCGGPIIFAPLEWCMSCVTLLSDFGLQDASVAIAKGIIMQSIPDVPLIDISHSVAPFHLQQAAYLLLAAYDAFPKKTVHVLLFDIFSEAQPRLLLCEHNGHFFLSPDNGLLPLAFGEANLKVWQCFEMLPSHVFRHWLHHCGHIAHKLTRIEPGNLGFEECSTKVAPRHWLPKFDGDTVECHVMHIDQYENVVVNLNRCQFDEYGQGRPFHIQLLRDEQIGQLSTHFNTVAHGQKLCRFNATGYLEIAINRGSAARLFGLKMYTEKQLMYNHIKIHFGLP